MRHWIRLVGVNERENPKSGMKLFRSNIYYYVLKKLYCVYTRSLLCIHKRISCVCTRDLLCMHNTLVHALGQGTQGPGTQKGSWAGPRPWTAAFLGPWPLGSLAQSMHKSVVHAQEISCVYTRDSSVYTIHIVRIK